MREGSILFKTLLLSTSQWNVYKHTQDKKKKRRVVGNTIGLVILFIMLMALCISMSIGYGVLGMTKAIPVLCALMISLLAFVLTLFKTNGYLFQFKDFDMLMSLPFRESTVAGCKFLCMYVDTLPWFASISLAMLISYGIYAMPGIWVYPVWIILSIFIPIIPMLLASFIGFIIARISSGFKKNNIVQVILIFAFIIFCFSLRFIIEDLIRDNKIQATLETASKITDEIAGYYYPAKWFSRAIVNGSILSMILLVGITVVLFIILFMIVGHSYMKVNSAMKSHAGSRAYKMTSLKKRPVVASVAFKELRRMLGSTQYLVNGAMGTVLSVLFALVVVIFGMDWIISKVAPGAPLDAYMLQPAIPFIIFFFTGMVATTTASPSLEGKNYWIIKSLPIKMKAVYQGKMLFNMLLNGTASVVAILLVCIASKSSVVDTILSVILGITLCAYSTCWGMVCGINHMNLDWENDVEVIKKGAAVAIYLVPNMIIVMGLIVLSVFLGTKMSHELVSLIFIAASLIIALICYGIVMKLAKKDS